MKSHERSITVIVPCRNAATTIGRLVEALLALDVPVGWCIELLVAYQESTDNTLELIENLPVKVVHSMRTGPSAARNDAATAASGEWLWFIDADARPVRRDYLCSFVRHLSCAVHPGAIGGPILLPPEQDTNLIAAGDHIACWFYWLPGRPSGTTRLFQPTTSVVISKKAFEDAGGFDASLLILEDYELQERIKRAGYCLSFCSELEVFHQARSSLLSSWRHSWSWGLPFRQVYIQNVEHLRITRLLKGGWFWLSLPIIYVGQAFFVLRQGFRCMPRQTLLSLPFILATVLAWALGVAVGGSRPEKPEHLKNSNTGKL